MNGRRHQVHQKQTKHQVNIIDILDFDWKYSDVTSFVIINIFISNCDYTFLDYSYIYFVIELHNTITFN